MKVKGNKFGVLSHFNSAWLKEKIETSVVRMERTKYFRQDIYALNYFPHSGYDVNHAGRSASVNGVSSTCVICDLYFKKDSPPTTNNQDPSIFCLLLFCVPFISHPNTCCHQSQSPTEPPETATFRSWVILLGPASIIHSTMAAAPPAQNYSPIPTIGACRHLLPFPYHYHLWLWLRHSP